MKYPSYRIETERLVLRCWNPDDAPRLKQTIDRNLDHLKPWMPWALQEPTDLQVKVDLLRFFRSQFDTGREFVYGIFDREEKTVLGGCGLHRRAGPEVLEIGYWLDKAWEGKGLVREASGALIDAAFGMDGIDRVEIHHDPRNLRSRAVPEALGFKFQSLRIRDNMAFQGTPGGPPEFRNSVVWVKYKSQPAVPGPIEYRAYSEVTPDFVRLTDELDRELRAKQGELQDTYFGFNRLDGIRDVVLAFVGGQAVGCASFKVRDAATAEVKRVFVRPEFRGRGISKGLMGSLENRARSQGIGVLLVETSRNFAEAVGLYRSLGYRASENFPPYVGLPESVCFSKELA